MEKKKVAKRTRRPSTPQQVSVLREAIARRAHEIYRDREAAGRPGDEISDWLAAERELASVA